MEAPDFKTFDIADMFAGISYPEDSVTINTDARAAFEIHRLKEEALRAVQDKDEAKGRDVESRLKALLEKAKNTQFTIHVRGVSRDDRRNVEEIVEAEFPTKRDLFGREEVNRAGNEKYENLMWALYITRIERPDGSALVAPTEADVALIRGRTPESELLRVAEAIRGLQEGAKGGFETLAQDTDFLSGASPEA